MLMLNAHLVRRCKLNVEFRRVGCLNDRLAQIILSYSPNGADVNPLP